jgi:flagellar hook-length control protein FliK
LRDPGPQKAERIERIGGDKKTGEEGLANYLSLGKEGARPTEKPTTNAVAFRSAVSEPEFLPELADRIRVQVQSGQGEIRIRLRPDSLGRLEIHAETIADSVVAKIATESNSVKSHLENHLHILQHHLEEQGLRVDRIEVVVQEGFDLHQQGPDHQLGESRKDGQPTPSTRDRSSSPNAARETTSTLGEARILRPNSTFHTVA